MREGEAHWPCQISESPLLPLLRLPLYDYAGISSHRLSKA